MVVVVVVEIKEMVVVERKSEVMVDVGELILIRQRPYRTQRERDWTTTILLPQ